MAVTGTATVNVRMLAPNPFEPIEGFDRETQLDHLLRDSRMFDDWDDLVAEVGEARANELGTAWVEVRDRLLGA